MSNTSPKQIVLVGSLVRLHHPDPFASRKPQDGIVIEKVTPEVWCNRMAHHPDENLYRRFAEWVCDEGHQVVYVKFLSDGKVSFYAEPKVNLVSTG